jgi:type IV pilus assembly protein PilV
MHQAAGMHRKQGGVMLLEALVAILLFSIGILAVVGMQATAVQDLSQAKYRSEAAFLSDQLISEMWGNSANVAQYAWGGAGTPPAEIASWVGTVQNRLPGATDFPPTIAVTPANQVTVTVRWRAPREKGENAPPHRYSTVAYISCC